MKRIICLILSALLVLSVFSPCAFALSTEDGKKEIIDAEENIDELRDLFKKAKYGNRNYAYFSPVKDENDETKYPVIVFLHGFGHEFTYLSGSFMPFWASEALQSKFSAGGAHIILPQIFHIAARQEKLQELIEDYIAQNEKNVDTDCIVIMGSSLGGAKALKLLVNHPGFYCASVVSCPALTPKTEALSAVNGTPIWLISAKRDIITGKHEKSWTRILDSTSVPEMCEWMFFDGKVHGPNGKGKLGHSLSKIICYDGVMFDLNSFADIYDDVSTVNGVGEKTDVTWEHGIIDWIERASALG